MDNRQEILTRYLHDCTDPNDPIVMLCSIRGSLKNEQKQYRATLLAAIDTLMELKGLYSAKPVKLTLGQVVEFLHCARTTVPDYVIGVVCLTNGQSEMFMRHKDTTKPIAGIVDAQDLELDAVALGTALKAQAQ